MTASPWPQVLFDLPESEAIICEVPCSLAPHRVAGVAYLTTRHLAFSTLAPSGGAAGGGAAAAAAVTLCHPLARVTFMTRSFVGRAAALSLTLFDKTLLSLYKFGGGAAAAAAARDDLYRAVLAHVAGALLTFSASPTKGFV